MTTSIGPSVVPAPSTYHPGYEGVQIVGDKRSASAGEPRVVTATVLPMHSGGAAPAASVTFLVDGFAAGPPVMILILLVVAALVFFS